MFRTWIYMISVAALLVAVTGQAQASPYDRAAYFDDRYPTGWAAMATAQTVRDTLEAAGYKILDADGLKTWMDGHIADRKLSVVVMCQDIPPETVAETNTADCTLRQYLNAGGKVVAYSDIPFYYQGHPDGTNTNWGTGGSTGILGFNAASAAWDSNNQVTITEDGTTWGLTETWSSVRPTAADAWDNLTILATDDSGAAAAWVAHYLAGDTFRGFVRTLDVSATPSIDDLMALAEYAEAIGTATGPQPDSGATDIPRDVVLSWFAGDSAVTHDVYFGVSLDDVNAASRSNPLGVLLSQGQTGTSFDLPTRLDFGQTYYWRIDEVNGAPDYTVFKGDIWSFTAEPFAYEIPDVDREQQRDVSEDGAGPENTVNGSGLNADDQHSIESTDMWLGLPAGDEPTWIEYEFDKVYKLHEMLVWNYNIQFELILGFGLKDVTVECSENGTDWTVLGEVQLNQATAKATYTANTTIDFQGVAAKYVRLTVNSGWGMMSQYGLSEVRFMYIPAQAREPQPDDGAIGLSPDVTLDWRAGREAASHEVYLSTSKSAVMDGTALVDVASDSSYTPAGIEFGSHYYWKIDEVNDAESISTWAGEIWSFVTEEYATVEGFETYNDDIDAATTIFDTWLDGWVNDNGSTVGYFDAPFAENSIVHSGRQSMPLAYDNTAAPFYSEAERTWDTPQDWTTNGADSVVLYVRGNAPGFAETTDGSILMNGIGADIWDVADQFRYAYKSLSGNGSIVARVDSVANTNGWAKAGVMIRETLDAGSTHAFVALTPANGVSFQRRPAANQASENTDAAGLVAPYWVKLTRTGDVFTAEQSADGQTWTEIVPATPVSISMSSNVYIGLALTSHDAALVGGAKFSEVSTTGNVSGSWQTAGIGMTQPEGNSAETLYVAVEDSSGKVKVVTNPDAEVALNTSWQQWRIPLSEFTGVNMSRVEKMYIGLGDRNAPSAGGSGLIYVDDIGYGQPFLSSGAADVLTPGDAVQGVPNDGDWPGAETPDLAFDNNTATKFLHFKGSDQPSGIRVTPSVGATVVTGLTLTTANDAAERDPIAFEVYGSNDGINGPYTLIASGDVLDFAEETAWPRFTINSTPIEFENTVAYTHYQVLFPTVRDAAAANSMQIAEIELIGGLAN